MGKITDRGYRVLLAHDNEEVLASVRDFLGERDGFNVATVTQVGDAVDILVTEGFDCVVSGETLTDGTGVELLRSANEDTAERVPFVLFVDGSASSAGEAIEAGVTDYIKMSMAEFVAGVEDPGTEQDDILANRIEKIVDKYRARANYREIFDKVNDAVFVHDPETGEILDVNRRMTEMYGYPKDEAVELSVEDLTPDDYTQEDVMEKIREVGRGGSQVFEWSARTADGDEFPTEVSLKRATIGGEERVLAIVRDITERKESERELRRANDLLRHTEEIADVGGWEVDTETDDLRWTEGTYDIHDLPTSYEPTVEEAIEFYHPDDREKIENAVESCREDGGTYDEELRLVTADDRLRWVRTRGEFVEDDGETTKLRGAIQDITQHKKQERRLRESEEKYRALVEQNLVGIYIVKDGIFDYVNPTMAEKLGTTPDEMVGTSPLEYVPDEEDRERMRDNIRRREEGEAESLRYSFTAETADGDRKRLTVHGTRVELSDGPAIVGALVETDSD